MQVVEIKGVRIGEGLPKTIASLMAPDLQGQVNDAIAGIEAGLDCLEIRADFCSDVHDAQAMVVLSKAVTDASPNNPVLFTLRSESQGGKVTLSSEEYAALNKAIIQAKAADMVDIEIGIGEEAVRELCDLARECGVVAVVSHHDFSGTPDTADMVVMLRRMEQLGAGICKIATMANTPGEALRLLSATEVFARVSTVPLLTMAMGAQGSITRLTGELFGSSMTFCSLQAASAPGQVPIDRARRLMQELQELVF